MDISLKKIVTKLSVILLTSIVLLMLSFSGCTSNITEKNKQPYAKNGILDLSQWDFNKNGTVRLDGEWEFYWEQLLTPEDFGNKKTGMIPQYFSVPAPWNGMTVNGQKIKGSGYATFRLVINLEDGEHLLSIKAASISSAFKLWVNGVLITSAGKVGRNAAEAVPEFKPGAYPFLIKGKNVELVMQIANYWYDKGGPWIGFVFGSQQQVNSTREKWLALELFSIGSLAIIAFYYICFYMMRRKDKAMLYFGLTCLTIAVRSLIVSEIYYSDIFYGVGWGVARKIEFISFYLCTLFFVLLFKTLFPHEFPKNHVAITKIMAICFVAQVIVLPLRIYSVTIIFYQAFVLYLVIASTIWIVLAYIRKREGALVSLIGMTIFYITVVNDILAAMQAIQTITLTPFGLIVFVFFQAVILAKRVSHAFSGIEDLSERLIRLDKMKDDFLANTSHELKTPLNGILGIAESMLEGAGGPLNKQQVHNLSIIVSSGKRLANLVKDILDFSRLKNHDLELQYKPVDLRQVAELVLNLTKPLSSGKPIELQNNIPEDIPLVFADESRVEQILHNLIGNAVKFTESGKVGVSAQKKDGMIEVGIYDTGIGIPEERFEDIFKPFEQVDSSVSRKYGGTGLGLHITKLLVELHGGKIFLESKPGTGSTFYFTLPVCNDIREYSPKDDFSDRYKKRPELIHVHEDVLVTPNSMISENSYKILIVDDEPVNLQVLTNQLSLKEYSVTAVSNGIEALNLIHGADPGFDLVILDIMMPRMSGYQVCRIIREKHSLLELPVLMLTAKSQLEDITAGFEAGANDYLAKPFDKAELLARVNTLLTLRSSVKFSITNARKLEMEWTSRLLAERLNDFTRTLSSTLEVGEVAKRVLESIQDIVPFEQALIVLKDRGRFAVIANRGWVDSEKNAQNGFEINESHVLKAVLDSEKPVIIGNTENDAAYRDFVLNTGIRSFICIPMIYNYQVSGIIALGHSQVNVFSDYLGELVFNFAGQAGIAFENAKLFEDIRKLATTDGLTGLFNRRHFFELAENEFERSCREHQPLSLIMMDIDNFKKINDNYGHRFGDQVLKSVAQLCIESMNNNGLIGRYGGEEFIILLSGMTAEEALQFAEKIRKSVEYHRIQNEKDENIKVTVSLGLCSLKESTGSLNTIIEAADNALYEAKKAGRNRVAVA
ncbi:MAG: diguanylate cyclase [Clostridia bacterium]|nr:diguanylate cyclase [Clostridia bacterium]